MLRTPSSNSLSFLLLLRNIHWPTMCQFKYTRHSCGHTLPKLEATHNPSCKLCVPVMVALKYYHDQVTQVCIENALQQPPLRMPKPCRPVAPNSLGEVEETAHIHTRDQTRFEEIMDRVGVNSVERSSVENLASRLNQTSKRNTDGPLRPVCPQHLWFMTELEVWQQRQFQPPNITFNTVSWGCGGTGPGVQGDCLVGWTGQGILMYRHGIWNVNPPHPSHTWSPLPVGYLYIDYGDAPVVKLPEVWRASATRTLIDIPMYKCLYAVLCGRPSGPLVQNDEGHLVPALGASGPEIPIAPYFNPAPPPPTSTGLPLPQSTSSVHMGQLRPPQASVPTARLNQGRRHRYSATWNSPAPIHQTAGGSNTKESQKQRTNKTYKERYSHSQTDAGQDRAKITTKIKELPQRRASRSGNATPASTTSPRASQPVHSRHPTPGNTRPATPTGNVPQSDDPTIGLGIIHESPAVPSVEARNEDAEGTLSRIYPHHDLPS